MNEQKQEQKPKRKILVEFTVPDEWPEVDINLFTDYFRDKIGERFCNTRNFLESARFVTPCNSTNRVPLDTLP